MWTRKSSASMMDQEDLVQAFVGTLSNDTGVNKVQHAVLWPAAKEVGELREILKTGRRKIYLEAKVSQFEQNNVIQINKSITYISCSTTKS